MTKRSISCCVAIYPPHSILQKATRVSQLLKEDGGLFMLDDKHYYPHVTLYMTEFPAKNLGRIKQLLQRIASKTRPFSMRPDVQRLHRGYVDISFRRTREVVQLHSSVVRTLNPLREGLMRSKDRRRLKGLTLREQRSLRRYGYNRALSGFIPHLTFTKLRKGSKDVRQRFYLPEFSFKSGRMALFRSAAHGTCRELMAQFKFGR